MTRHNDLFLHEETMLLALKDEEGTLESGTMYQYAIGGAVLAELLLAGRIRATTERKKTLVEPLSAEPLGDPLIDECLGRIHEAKKRKTLQTWVSKFGRTRDLKHRVAQQLSRRGILRVDEDKVMLIFTRKIYPELNPVPEKELTDRLHQAIFGDAPEVDPRTVTLVSLVDSARVLKKIFDKNELKKRKPRIKQIVNGELTGKATREAIQAMEAAIMVAAVMPAVIAATMSVQH